MASALAEEKGITLETEISAKKPVVGDCSSVALILENLMENAVKYNRSGGRIRLVVSENAEWTEVTVSNTGKPIPTERQAYIFQRFFRAHGDDATSGSGLGLSIAKELTEANDGQLELVSSIGDWTQFRLRLPSRERPNPSKPIDEERYYANG